MSEDVRVQKTKERIKSSLAELLQDYPFHEISVRMITERANVNRSTFYRNYLDKYDLLDKIQEEMLYDFGKNIDIRFIELSEEKPSILHATLTKNLKFIYSKREEFIIFWNAQTPRDFFTEMCALMDRTLCGYLENANPDTKKSEIIALYSTLFTNITMITIKWWLEAAETKSIDEMIWIMTNNIDKGIVATLKELI